MLVAIAFFHFFARPEFVLHSTDSVYYLAGAKSLAEGTGYRMVLYDDAPRIGLYPPLQSFYLSLFWRLNGSFPANLWLLQSGMVGLILLTSTLLYFVLLRCRAPLWFAALLSLSFAVQPNTYVNAIAMMSDLLFATLSFSLALWWLGRREDFAPRHWWVSGILLGLMFLTRTAAAPILLGTGLALSANAVFRRQWRPLFWCVAPMAAAVAFWMLFPKDTLTYGHYYRETEDGNVFARGLSGYLLQCGLRAIRYASTELVECITAGTPQFLASVFPASAVWLQTCRVAVGLIAFAAVLLAAFGYCRHSARVWRVIGAILLLYYVQIIFWPWELGPRAVMPLLPFLCIGFTEGIKHLPALARHWMPRAVSLVLLIGIVPSAWIVCTVKAHPQDIHREDEVKALSIWARDNIPANARLATHLDWAKSQFPMMHFVSWSGHRLTQTRGENAGIFARRADYLLFESFPTARNSVELPEPGAVGQVIYRTPLNTFQVLRVVRTRATETAN